MNLSNHFLIAMPQLQDSFFEESLVFICEHNDEGAMGVIINKPSPMAMHLVLQGDGNNVAKRFDHNFIMMGGPVQLDRGFVVHTPIGSWQSSLAVSDDTALTTSRDIIDSMGNDERVQKALLTIGHASWEKGQLEKELAENAWLTVSADLQILFDLPPNERYGAALAKLGIRPEALSRKAGYA